METKLRILAAASTVMTEKGMQDSTIAEIAAQAKVAESVIYHHFKNKEDLLFSITANHLKRVLDELHHQLEGIFEPLSQLSKMIWFHLHYNLTHKDYSYLLLYECRSNLNFYQHTAYALIKQYAMVLSDIIESGIQKGVFRSTLDHRLVRDIILGTLDWETIRLLMPSGRNAPILDIEPLMDNIVAMISANAADNDIEADKAKRILIAAEKVFAEKGYHKATISEIARLSKVAEGTVYEYYANKEDLLLSIPQTRFLEQIEMLEEIFVIRDPVKKLRRFIRYHSYLYTNNPHFLRVFLLNICLNPRFHQSPSFITHERYTSIVDHILEEGKAEGVFRESIDNKVFKNMFFGGFSHIAMRWEILKSNQTHIDKMHEVDDLVDLMHHAVVYGN
jgi:TetR/AcrR family transcriptional regulator, fatty acid metabolism regulator protein